MLIPIQIPGLEEVNQTSSSLNYNVARRGSALTIASLTTQ